MSADSMRRSSPSPTAGKLCASRSRISYSSRRAYESLAAVKQVAFEALAAPLRYAQEKGALKKGDIEDFGLALAALVHGLVGEFIDEGLGGRQSQKQPWSKVRREMARRMIELLLNGIAA